MRTILVVLAFAFSAALVPLSAGAQTPKEPVKSVSARLLFLTVAREEPTGIHILVGKDRVPVRAPKNFFAPPIDYVGSATLVLFRKSDMPALPATPPAAVPPPPPFATVELPPAGGEFLVLIGGTADTPRLALLDFSPERVPVGSYLIWNLTQRRIGVALGETKAVLAAGRQSLLRPTGGEDRYMGLYVYDQFEGGDRRLFAARHYHVDTTRQLVLVGDIEEPARVRVKIITQRVFASPATVVRRD